jgi:hypothetical protein
VIEHPCEFLLVHAQKERDEARTELSDVHDWLTEYGIPKEGNLLTRVSLMADMANEKLERELDEATSKAVADAERNRLAMVERAQFWRRRAALAGDTAAASDTGFVVECWHPDDVRIDLIRVTQERDEARSNFVRVSDELSVALDDCTKLQDELATLRAQMQPAPDPDTLPEPPVGCRWVPDGVATDLMYWNVRLGQIYESGNLYSWNRNDGVNGALVSAGRDTRRAAALALIAAVGVMNEDDGLVERLALRIFEDFDFNPDEEETVRIAIAEVYDVSDLARVTLRSTLGFDGPWPLFSVLKKLADAADHLLNEHSCDAHGYEEVGAARDSARRIIAKLVADLNKGSR